MLKQNVSVFISAVTLLTLLGCAPVRDRTRVSDYNRFAIKAAQAELWNEAIFRWQQVVAMEPNNAKAHNNLGVAYEALGKTDDAIAAYQRATKLAPGNQYYRLNYRRCRIHVRRRGIPEDGDEQLEFAPEEAW